MVGGGDVKSSTCSVSELPGEDTSFDRDSIANLDKMMAARAPLKATEILPPKAAKEFYLPNLIDLEKEALKTRDIRDCALVWSIPYYAQRKYFFKLFTALNFGLFAPLLTHWTLSSIPDRTYSHENIKIYRYLMENSGIEQMESALAPLKRPNKLQKRRVSDTASESVVITHRPMMKTIRARLSLDGFNLGLRRTSNRTDAGNLLDQAEDELTQRPRQSKLSQEQLSELQRSTHFDKKELQQWYKGIDILHS